MAKNPNYQIKTLKKKKLVGFLILSILLFSLTIEPSSARLSTSVEVKEGESYRWSLKLNISNYLKLIENTGGGYIDPEILGLNLPGNVDIGIDLLPVSVILEILNTHGEFIVDSFFDVYTTIVEAELRIAPEFNITKLPLFYPLNFTIKPTITRANFSVLKADTPNYFSIPIGFFLIVPTDLVWTIAATQLQSYFGRNYLSSNYTVLQQDNGLRITQPADTTILASELNLNYNSKGVLETADGSYNGAALFSLELASKSSIAFEMPFLLSVAAIAVAILILRKKNKYTLIS